LEVEQHATRENTAFRNWRRFQAVFGLAKKNISKHIYGTN